MKDNGSTNKYIKVTGGSAGTITAGKVAAITAGAKGALEVSGEDIPRKINWTGKLETLRALFELLYEAGYIDKLSFQHIPSLMANDFLHDNQEISRKSQKGIEKKEDYQEKKLTIFDDLIGTLDKANSYISARITNNSDI